jgi:hypothetical protein
MNATLTPSEVMIFKTNIETEQDLNAIARILNGETTIRKWNVDREDIDRVLRIESDSDLALIRQKIEFAGFLCEELTD